METIEENYGKQAAQSALVLIGYIIDTIQF